MTPFLLALSIATLPAAASDLEEPSLLPRPTIEQLRTARLIIMTSTAPFTEREVALYTLLIESDRQRKRAVALLAVGPGRADPWAVVAIASIVAVTGVVAGLLVAQAIHPTPDALP